jgi:dipeptide/tripeptide permease
MPCCPHDACHVLVGALQVAVFEGTCYTTPIIGALLADSVWGRYKTIIVFSLIYLVVSHQQHQQH